MEIIRLADIGSTNDYLLGMNTERELCAVSDYQSGGKGMGTNTWESERGKNLLFSLLIHPQWLVPSMQYLLSMAEALALYDALKEETAGADGELTIKWPNDIYWSDRKLSGTRIDVNCMGSRLHDAVIGTGINVNQTRFVSDAPNPVSLKQITGREHDAEEILGRIIDGFARYMDIARMEYTAAGRSDTIASLYHRRLYRREGFHWYADADGEFEAEIAEVQPNGMMTLRRRDGETREYEFKEVRCVIDNS